MNLCLSFASCEGVGSEGGVGRGRRVADTLFDSFFQRFFDAFFFSFSGWFWDSFWEPFGSHFGAFFGSENQWSFGGISERFLEGPGGLISSTLCMKTKVPSLNFSCIFKA